MASQDSRLDRNHVPSQMGVAGSVGTGFVGTEDLIQFSGDPTTGAQYVYNLGPSGAVTINPNLPVIAGTPADPGTPIIVRLTDGTNYYNASGAAAGTNVNIVTGSLVGTVSLNSSGTVLNLATGTLASVGTLPGIGTVTNLGSFTSGGTIKEITNIAGGTVTTTLALNTGTLTTIAAGTQNTLGTVGTLLGGGTITNLGSVTNAGTVKEVTTVPTVTTVSNLTNGTVRIALGTIIGPTASGGTPTTAPILVAGTDVTGTVYAPLINVAGALSIVEVPKGTITVSNPVSAVTATVGTIPGVGTLTNVGSITNIGTVKEVTLVPTVSNLTNGSANILTGTIQSSGTTTGVGVVTSVSELVKGTVTNLATGTINALASGTVTAGTLTNLVSGTINALAAGTITTGTVSVTTGTVVLNTGTITTIAAGTQNTLGTVGNLNNGSVNLLTGTVTSVTNLAGGTVQVNPTPTATTLTQGTLGTAGGSFFGTLSAASGAGTKHYITGLTVVVQSGTPDVRILAGTSIQGTGVLAGGAFVPSAGVSRDFTTNFATGTNSELTYHFVNAGTAFITVQYWKGA